ncbi:hypothetical protein QUF72_00310 [Desulfobacterales bacterium HSG2]|nr:hypothetical protein [Desulfobacterales bacterium HSG2]
MGQITQNLIYEAFRFSGKYDCEKNVKFGKLPLEHEIFDKVKSYSAKEAGDIILFDKKHSYEVKWSFATTAGNEKKMILSKAELCDRINYKPILLIFSEPVPRQARKSYRDLKNKFSKYGEVFEKSDAWKHLRQMTGINLRNIFENHLKYVAENDEVKRYLEFGRNI